MADELTIHPESDDTFECVQFSKERLPNDFHEWPEDYRKASDEAIAKLIAEHPGSTVVSDTSECIDETHPRFPDGERFKGMFVAVRTVKLDEVGHDSSTEEQSTHDRLRAFEDGHLGEDAPRHLGKIEKGSGSPFSRNDDRWGEAHRAHHAALENLIEAEREHAEAEARMGAVHAKLEAAIERAKATEEAL